MAELVTRGLIGGHRATDGFYGGGTTTTTTSSSTSSSTLSSTSSTLSSSSTNTSSVSSSSSTSSTSTSSSSISSSSSSISSTSSSSSSTSTLAPTLRINLMPSDRESAFYRRKNDERVEVRGTPCRLIRAGDGAITIRDSFDDFIVSKAGSEPKAVDSFVIIEPYQTDRNKIGDDQGTEYTNFPFTATFRFYDNVRRLDLVEIPYEYARAAGLTIDFSGSVRQTTKRFYTRFKLLNRVTHGINADLVNKFFITPTEESWIV